MGKIRLCLTVIMMMATSLFVQAQEPYAIHYDKETYFNNAAVYHVFQDSKNYLWFGTSKGVYRFNGTEWKHFSMVDGLFEDEAFRIREDSKGNIWLMHMHNGFTYIRGDRVFVPEIMNARIDSILYPASNRMIIYEFGLNDTIYIGTRQRCFIKATSSGYAEKIPILKNGIPQFISGSHAIDLENSYKNELNYAYVFQNRWLTKPIFSSGYSVDKSLERIMVEKPGFIVDTVITQSLTATGTGGGYLNFKDIHLIRNAGDVYQIDHRGKLVKKLGLEETYVVDSLNDSTVVICGNDGLRLYNEEIEAKHHYLKGKPVSFCLTDRENGVWATTLHNGVYYFPDFNNRYYLLKSEGPIETFDVVHPEELFYGDREGNVRRFSAHVGSELLFKDTRTHVLKFLDTGLLLIGSYSQDEKIDVESKINYRNFYRATTIVENKNVVWVGDNRAMIFGFDFGRNKVTNFSKIVKQRFRMAKPRCLYMVDSDNMLVGTINGIFHINLKNKVGKRLLKTRLTVNGIKKIDGNIWFSTTGMGLGLLNGQSVTYFNSSNSTIADHCRSLQAQGDSILWLASENRIQKIRVNGDRVKGVSEAFIHEPVVGMELNNGFVSCVTTTGILRMNRNYFSKSRSVHPIILEGLTVNNQNVDEHFDMQLEHNRNNIQIEFTNNSFRFPDSKIRYRLREEDMWKEAKSRSISFANLKPDYYAFEVQQLVGYNKWSQTYQLASFTVNPIFYNTTWFRLTGIGLLLLIVSSYYYLNITRLRSRKQYYKTRFLLLASQLNPHFVFNALNTLQKLIIKDDPKQAEAYLGLFSKLLRNVLSNSRRQLIPFEEEIDLLSKYVKLESMRYKKEIALIVKMDRPLNPSRVFIPAFLIQPLVENAVHHGLLSKNGGSITVKVKDAGKRITIDVIDDGIGLQNESVDSKGLSIVSDRLEQLCAEYNCQGDFRVRNRADNTGVHVSFIIPKLSGDAA